MSGVIFGGVVKSVTTCDRRGGVKKYRKKRDVIIERSQKNGRSGVEVWFRVSFQ